MIKVQQHAVRLTSIAHSTALIFAEFGRTASPSWYDMAVQVAEGTPRAEAYGNLPQDLSNECL
jgi:hypothetical protein